jgi:hypothetical protein
MGVLSKNKLVTVRKVFMSAVICVNSKSFTVFAIMQEKFAT